MMHIKILYDDQNTDEDHFFIQPRYIREVYRDFDVVRIYTYHQEHCFEIECEETKIAKDLVDHIASAVKNYQSPADVEITINLRSEIRKRITVETK